MIIFVLLLIIVIIYYVNFRRSRKLLYKLSDTLPNVGDIPIIGHSHWFLGGPERLLNNIKTLAGKLESSAGDITKIWIGPHLYVVSFNLDDVQKILENCLEKDSSYKFLRTWLGNGLFVAPVDLWKSHRRLLLPVFNNKVIDDYIGVFVKQGKVLVRCLEKHVGKSSFDIHNYVTSCMLDIVFETAMGEKMEVQTNANDNPYITARSKVMSIISMRLFKPWLQPDALFNLTAYSKIQKKNIDYTHKFTDEVIQRKRLEIQNNNGMKSNGMRDILELIILKDGTLTNQQLREHIDSITIAGNDTTALVISYTILLLGCHEKEQEKVYRELNEVFGNSDRSPSRDDLSRLDYLERVIKETMRLYTVVPIIARKTQTELKLSSCTLPAGVGCAVLPFILHRSKSIWGPDADEFNPDRFLPENSVNRHPCAYMPFSHGLRNCIGRHFGMLAMKIILANILRNYKISSEQCDRLKIEILLFPVNGHLVKLEKRNENISC